MQGFYVSKTKYIKCIDCEMSVERITPNHKRCVNCAYKKSLERAIENNNRYSKESKREYAKLWYQRNQERERSIRLKRYHEIKRNGTT